ncbi:MAG: hypothetical protein QW377_02130 [Candidatus Pacearchaeota archaeon]
MKKQLEKILALSLAGMLSSWLDGCGYWKFLDAEKKVIPIGKSYEDVGYFTKKEESIRFEAKIEGKKLEIVGEVKRREEKFKKENEITEIKIEEYATKEYEAWSDCKIILPLAIVNSLLGLVLIPLAASKGDAGGAVVGSIVTASSIAGSVGCGTELAKNGTRKTELIEARYEKESKVRLVPTNEISERTLPLADVQLKVYSPELKPINPAKTDEKGIAKKGVCIRHLILPNNAAASELVVEFLKTTFDPADIFISLMAQYRPLYKAKDFAEINRRITIDEYERAKKLFCEAGFLGFYQEYEALDTAFCY